MSRNLRYIPRDYSEPIKINIYEDITEDFVVIKGNTVTYDWYGMVLIDFDNQSSANNSLVQSNGIKIKILKPVDFKIIPQKTSLLVRDELYVVTQTESIALDDESIVLRGKMVING